MDSLLRYLSCIRYLCIQTMYVAFLLMILKELSKEISIKTDLSFQEISRWKSQADHTLFSMQKGKWRELLKKSTMQSVYKLITKWSKQQNRVHFETIECDTIFLFWQNIIELLFWKRHHNFQLIQFRKTALVY